MSETHASVLNTMTNLDITRSDSRDSLMTGGLIGWGK